MSMALPGRREFVEQQLFSLHADLGARRCELDVLAEQLDAARHAFEEAARRVGTCETPLTVRQLAATRRRLHALEGRYADATSRIACLERDQDALFSKLVG